MRRLEINILFSIFVFLFIVAPASLSGAEYTDIVLDNGLKVLIMEDHSVPLVAVRVCYHVGIKDECPGLTGITSLCEKIIKEGTKAYRKGALSKIIQAGGGYTASNTDWDVTHFFIKVPANMLDTALVLEADRMANIIPTSEKLLLAKDNVRKRRLGEVESSLYGRINEEYFNLAYIAHPYGHNKYGWPDDVDRINLDDLEKHLRRFFQPANALLVIAGDIESDGVLARVKELFGKIRSIPLDDRRPITDPVQVGERRSAIEGDVGIPAIIIGYKIPPVTHPDITALRLIRNILTSGISSRLYRHMVLDEKSALHVDGGLIEPEGPGLVYSYAILNYDSPLDVGERQLLAEIDRLKTEYVSEAELEKAKNRALVDFFKTSRTLDNKTGVVGTYKLIADDPHFTKKRIEKLQSVTIEDIMTTAKKYFMKSRRIIVTVSPPGTEISNDSGGDYE